MNKDDNTVGLIGLGLLGTAMAQRWLQSGYRVVGYDVDVARQTALGELGGTATDDALGAVQPAGRTVLCLPDSAVVAEVVGQIEAAIEPGAIVVDTTTGAAEASEAALNERRAARTWAQRLKRVFNIPQGTLS